MSDSKAKSTKQNLKTMSKTSKAHKLRSTSRIFKYGAIGFARNVWLSIASTLVMTITLVILFVTIIASAILSSTADTMREKIDITIYFKPGTSITALGEMASVMSGDENVKSVEVSTSEEEYDKFLADNTDDQALMSALDDSAMRELMISTMQATMRIKLYDIDDLSGIENIVDNNRIFITTMDQNKPPTYDVNRAEIETITSWANIARNGGIILSIIFLAISILVIFNTIRMAIFSRREEIYMMKLVGADNSFIRGPFLIEAQICGAISGIVASTIGYFGFHALAPHLKNYGINISAITDILETSWLVVVFLVIIAIGILIGTVSSSLAIHKYLRGNKKRHKHKK